MHSDHAGSGPLAEIEDLPTVVHIVHDLAIGGGQRSVLDLVSASEGQGYHHVLAVLGQPLDLSPWLNGRDIPIVVLGPGSFCSILARLTRLLRDSRAVLVHAQNHRETKYALLGALLLRIPLLVHLRHIPRAKDGQQRVDRVKRLRLLLERRIVRAFVGVSPPVTDYYRQRKPGPVVTVNNGVPALDIMEAVEAIRERADRSLGVPMLVAIGRLTEEKGHDVLFKAFGLMHESGLSFRARIVGDGPLRDRLEALAGTLGIAHLVEVTGLKADVVEDLASADIYVSPSHTEGFGRAVVEAMAAGLPVVATDIPAMRGIIEDGVEGVLVPAGDPAAMAAALGRLLGSRDGWPALSAAARRRALSFDISQTAQRMRQVYDLVISGRPSDQIVAALAAEPTSQWPTRLDRQESA